LNNWGRKRCHNHKGHQQFPNGCAEILTGGTQEVSQKVLSDEKPFCAATAPRLDGFSVAFSVGSIQISPRLATFLIIFHVFPVDRSVVAGNRI
jgi:hypothetical protein